MEENFANDMTKKYFGYYPKYISGSYNSTSKKKNQEINQDGGVEGRALTPS